uniref:Dynein cytoplasmic 1 intermediate chain 1 n=1 Tax=Sinocyclocheilus rhinocerous TaxID=307959 RepID=A0A673HMD5_9TELE
IREEKKRKEEEKKKKESETQQKAEAAPEDSDLHCRHRGTKALLEHWNLTRTSIRYSTQTTGPLGLRVGHREAVKFGRYHKTEIERDLLCVLSEDEEEDEEVTETKAGPENDLQEEEESHPRELTEEEKQQVLHSEEFLIFFDRSIRVIERALDKEGDLQGGSSLSLNRLFYDERWSKHQVITCLDWSSQYPELLVASYNNNEDAPHEPDDVALVWNMKFKKTTQRVHLPLPVVSVGFARFHPNLLVGGTYSGQIVLWDNRSHRRTPVQRTPLSAAAHTHPIYCVNVVGTQNASNLITASTDGRMCSWSLDMLSQPQSMELVYNKSKPVAVTGMVFPTGDVNNYIVGSEEGTVYTASRHGRLVAHTPPTCLSCLPFHSTFLMIFHLCFLMLCPPQQNKPLMGRLDLWNLNNDTEVPTASVTIEGAPALNCIRWASGGKEVAVGDSEGPHFGHTLMEIRANRGDGEEEGPVELAT